VLVIHAPLNLNKYCLKLNCSASDTDHEKAEGKKEWMVSGFIATKEGREREGSVGLYAVTIQI
jgi:hypothetical protein